MEAVIQPTFLTAEQFYDQYAGVDGRFDLVEGVVRETPPVGPDHGDIDAVFSSALGPYARKHGLGRVYINTGFILNTELHTVRAPDEAFVSAPRIADNPPPKRGFWPIVPDLVLEIVSPDDTAGDIAEKVRDYLAYGVRLVWVLYPLQKQMIVYYPSGDARILREDSVLEGEDVVPGFRLPLPELWG